MLTGIELITLLNDKFGEYSRQDTHSPIRIEICEEEKSASADVLVDLLVSLEKQVN